MSASLLPLEPMLILLSLFSSDMITRVVDGFVPIYVLLVLVILFASYQESGNHRQSVAKGGMDEDLVESSGYLSSPAPAVRKSLSSAKGSPKGSLTGSYKLYKNTNYQKFLEVQGVGWALRKGEGGVNDKKD